MSLFAGDSKVWKRHLPGNTLVVHLSWLSNVSLKYVLAMTAGRRRRVAESFMLRARGARRAVNLFNENGMHRGNRAFYNLLDLFSPSSTNRPTDQFVHF